MLRMLAQLAQLAQLLVLRPGLAAGSCVLVHARCMRLRLCAACQAFAAGKVRGWRCAYIVQTGGRRN